MKFNEPGYPFSLGLWSNRKLLLATYSELLFGLSAVGKSEKEPAQSGQPVCPCASCCTPQDGLGEPPLHSMASTTLPLRYCLGRNPAAKMHKRPFTSTQARAALADLGKTAWIRVWVGRRRQRSTERPWSPAVTRSNASPIFHIWPIDYLHKACLLLEYIQPLKALDVINIFFLVQPDLKLLKSHLLLFFNVP